MAQHPDEEIRRIAIKTIALSEALRSRRITFGLMPFMGAIPSARAGKERLVYDLHHATRPLPGDLVRSEGQPPCGDEAADEAYDFSGYTYDFYKEIYNRNSLDDKGMSLRSSVHFGSGYDNAFFNGEQMVYGDGDRNLFIRFTKSLDVVAHELTHGVTSYTCQLEYQDEPGALNEHFSDVAGQLVSQWYLKQTVDQAIWLVGHEIMGPGTHAKALRTFKAEKAYDKDPSMGTDPQPKHMKDKYTGTEDNGGVHINSGIPNHAFYVVAMELKGHAWEKAGPIWYKTQLALTTTSNFQDAAVMTYQTAGTLYGPGSNEQKAVQKGWKAVGIDV
jgi:Zn-dependent metalloprotease